MRQQLMTIVLLVVCARVCVGRVDPEVGMDVIGALLSTRHMHPSAGNCTPMGIYG